MAAYNVFIDECGGSIGCVIEQTMPNYPHNDHDIAYYREMHIYFQHEMRAAIKQDLDRGQGIKMPVNEHQRHTTIVISCIHAGTVAARSCCCPHNAVSCLPRPFRIV
jgi:hypothetical protein